MLRIGIDTGGTFTDVAVLDRGRLRIHKVPSTPDDPARAVLGGLADVRDDRPVDVVHGTTVGLNAILTGHLARTALVTNAGFRDLCEIGRQDRTDLYALEPSRPVFPVPRELRFELGTRRAADGRVLVPLETGDLDALVTRLRRARVESVAVALLHSWRDARDERRVARALRVLGVPVTCSADLLPRHGEFERFSAAALNAAIRPVVGGYMARLRSGVRPGRVRLMRSSGGVLSDREGVDYPARAVFSGPAGGVLATARVAAARGADRVAALDMGGTSTDVALVGQRPAPAEADATIAGLPLAVPSFDVHTIGCGGGSLAYVDAGGALRVGPESAGADPGPACYGRAEEPTVTDAHVALGHLGADSLLDGAFPIEPDRSVRAIERLARRLGISTRRCAEGVLEVADVAMMRALLRITVARSIDPRGVPLIAYGGAGGLHAAALAARLGMPWALVPRAAGGFSAVGLALAGASEERLEAVMAPLAALGERTLRDRASALVTAARESLEDGRGRVRRSAEVLLRFRGQGRGLWVPIGPARSLAARFAAVHEARFGFASDDTPIEVVELRARVLRDGPPLPHHGSWSAPGRSGHEPAHRRPPIGGRPIAIRRRDALRQGRPIDGPAILTEATGTVRVPAGWRAIECPDGCHLTPAKRAPSSESGA